MNNTDLKWVACWGNATSITDRREAVYAKNLTLRYPVRMPFAGSALRFRFSNLTGTEPVTLSKVFVGTPPLPLVVPSALRCSLVTRLRAMPSATPFIVAIPWM